MPRRRSLRSLPAHLRLFRTEADRSQHRKGVYHTADLRFSVVRPKRGPWYLLASGRDRELLERWGIDAEHASFLTRYDALRAIQVTLEVEEPDGDRWADLKYLLPPQGWTAEARREARAAAREARTATEER